LESADKLFMIFKILRAIKERRFLYSIRHRLIYNYDIDPVYYYSIFFNKPYLGKLYYTNQLGEYPDTLGGILFSSVSPDNAMYLDYFCYSDWGGGGCNLNIDKNKTTNFKIFPNPSNNLINIQSNRSIKTVKVYDVIGNQVLVTSETYHINISSLSKGLYFIAVETENARSIQKFIKK
jgi:hypothetical protein